MKIKKITTNIYSKINKIKKMETKISLGCGDKCCVNRHNYYFCSRYCRNDAVYNCFIKDPEDIDYEESGLKLKDTAIIRLFGKNLDLEPSILKEFIPLADKTIGCGENTCVSKENLCFCSSSCKNAALRDHFINKDIDISPDNHLMLTQEAHEKLQNYLL